MTGREHDLDHQWVEVRFYGRVPRGQVMTDLDALEMARNLMQTFGFDAIDGLTVIAHPHPTRREV